MLALWLPFLEIIGTLWLGALGKSLGGDSVFLRVELSGGPLVGGVEGWSLSESIWIGVGGFGEVWEGLWGSDGFWWVRFEIWAVDRMNLA